VVAFTRGDRTVDMTTAAARLRGRVWTARGLGKVGLRRIKEVVALSR